MFDYGLRVWGPGPGSKGPGLGSAAWLRALALVQFGRGRLYTAAVAFIPLSPPASSPASCRVAPIMSLHPRPPYISATARRQAIRWSQQHAMHQQMLLHSQATSHAPTSGPNLLQPSVQQNSTRAKKQENSHSAYSSTDKSIQSTAVLVNTSNTAYLQAQPRSSLRETSKGDVSTDSDVQNIKERIKGQQQSPHAAAKGSAEQHNFQSHAMQPKNYYAGSKSARVPVRRASASPSIGRSGTVSNHSKKPARGTSSPTTAMMAHHQESSASLQLPSSAEMPQQLQTSGRSRQSQHNVSTTEQPGLSCQVQDAPTTHTASTFNFVPSSASRAWICIYQAEPGGPAHLVEHSTCMSDEEWSQVGHAKQVITIPEGYSFTECHTKFGAWHNYIVMVDGGFALLEDFCTFPNMLFTPQQVANGVVHLRRHYNARHWEDLVAWLADVTLDRVQSHLDNLIAKVEQGDSCWENLSMCWGAEQLASLGMSRLYIADRIVEKRGLKVRQPVAAR